MTEYVINENLVDSFIKDELSKTILRVNGANNDKIVNEMFTVFMETIPTLGITKEQYFWMALRMKTCSVDTKREIAKILSDLGSEIFKIRQESSKLRNNFEAKKISLYKKLDKVVALDESGDDVDEKLIHSLANELDEIAEFELLVMKEEASLAEKSRYALSAYTKQILVTLKII